MSTLKKALPGGALVEVDPKATPPVLRLIAG
jgi:hypothetical protein